MREQPFGKPHFTTFFDRHRRMQHPSAYGDRLRPLEMYKISS